MVIFDAELAKLFNIIEFIANSAGETDTTIEDTLNGSTIYDVYNSNTFGRSSTQTSANKYTNVDDGAGLLDDVSHWITFTCTLNSNIIDFKIWLSETEFLADYPHSHIQEIVWPDTISNLYNPPYTTNYDALTNTSNFINTTTAVVVAAGDNTGVKILTTDYHPAGSPTIQHDVSLGAIYKGQVPTIAEIRAVAKQELLDSGLATEEVWKTIFPGLMAQGRCYLIPIYDNTVNVALVGEMPQGIINHKKIHDVVGLTIPTIDQAFLESKVEVLVSAASELYIGAIIDPTNSPEFESLHGEHPTYQPTDAQGLYFDKQQQHTQDFNIRLSQAVAKATGANNTYLFTEETIGGRDYITFIENFKEYYLLLPSSYPLSLP